MALSRQTQVHTALRSGQTPGFLLQRAFSWSFRIDTQRPLLYRPFCSQAIAGCFTPATLVHCFTSLCIELRLSIFTVGFSFDIKQILVLGMMLMVQKAYPYFLTPIQAFTFSKSLRITTQSSDDLIWTVHYQITKVDSSERKSHSSSPEDLDISRHTTNYLDDFFLKHSHMCNDVS